MRPRTVECAICGGEARLVHAEREIPVGRRRVVVEDEFYRCTACDEEFYVPGQLAEVQQSAAADIRRREGLLFPDEIRAIRERYGLTQDEFEKVLGVGPKTAARWELGTVFQSAAMDSLLRLLAANPENAKILADLHGVDLRNAA